MHYSAFSMLNQKKKMFADVFYTRHRHHVIGVVKQLAILLVLSGTAMSIAWFYITLGEGSVALTSLLTAIFLWLGWCAYESVPGVLQVRLIPYFERRIDGPDTWSSGVSLLWCSRQLDATAESIGVQPLSNFASGDDLISSEELCWFSSEKGLRTIERLTEPDMADSLPRDAVSDLKKLRDALRIASAKDVDFCLLLREGTSASGLEMAQRQGSFF